MDTATVTSLVLKPWFEHFGGFWKPNFKKNCDHKPTGRNNVLLFHKFGVFRYKTTIKKNLTEKKMSKFIFSKRWSVAIFMQIPHCLFFCLVGFFHISRLCKTEYKLSFNLRHGWWNSPLAARRTFPSWESQFECAVLKHNECHN